MSNLLPFNPTPSFPSAQELAAILAPAPIAPKGPRLVLSMNGNGTSGLVVRPLDPATLASQSMPRQDGGLGSVLWDMFANTHRPA